MTAKKSVKKRKKVSSSVSDTKESLSLLQSTMNSTADGILVVDRKGKASFFNKRFLKLWKIPKKVADSKDDKKLLGYVLKQLSNPDEFLKKVNYLYKHPSKESFDKIYFKDGRTFERLSIPQILDKKVVGRVWSFRDVSREAAALEELRSVKKTLELQVERMPIAQIMWDKDFRVTSWNPAAQKIFGFSKKYAMGKHPYDMIVPGTIQKDITKIWKRLLKGDKTAHSRNENLTQDGRTILCQWSNTPLIDASGKIMGVLSMVEDVTEKYAAEKALKNSEERYRLITENTTDFVSLTDLKGRFTYVSESHRQLGYTSKDLIGKNSLSFLHKSDYKKLFPVFKKYAVLIVKDPKGFMKKKLSEKVTYRFRKKDGSFSIVDAVASLIVDSKGEVRILYVSRDVTDRIKIEQTIRESEEKYASIFDNVNDTIVLIGRDGIVEKITASVKNLGGYKKEDFLGKRISALTKIFPAKSLARILTNFAGRLLGKDAGTYIVDGYGKDGKLRNIEITGSSLKVCGKIEGTLAVLRDVTDSITAERELKENERRLSDLYAAMNEGVALHEVVYDKKGKAIDYILTYVNPKFEKLIGLSKADVIGKRATKIYKTRTAPYLDIYAKVAKTQKPYNFETFFPPYNQYFSISVFSPTKGQFATVFSDVTLRKTAEDEIRASEERLKLLFETAPDGNYILDVKGNFVEGNKQAERITGYDRNELIGKSFLKAGLLPKKHLITAAKIFAANLSGKPTGPDELELKRPDGTLVPVEISSRPIEIGGKKFIQGVARDITERKKVESALKESEEKFSKAFYTTPVLMAISTIDTGEFIEVNKAFLDILKYNKNDIEGRTSTDLDLFVDPEQRKKVITQMASKGSVTDVEIQIRGKNGRIFDMLFSASPITFNNKQHLLTIAEDMTERKQASEKIKESEKKYRAIFNSSPEAIVLLDSKGTVVDLNSRLHEWTGQSIEKTKGKNLLTLPFIPKESKVLVMKNLAKRLAGKDVAPFDVEFIDSKGNSRFGRVTASLITDASGKTVNDLVVISDVTEAKQWEDKLKAAYDETKQRNEELERFNKLAVGREIRMVQLKKHLKELEERDNE